MTGRQPYTDSGRLLDDPAALKRLLAQDGYLCLPGLLRTAVDDVARDVLAVARDAGWVRPAQDGRGPADTVPGTAVWPPDPRFHAVHHRAWRLRSVHALMHHPALLDLMAALLGETVLVHPRKVLRLVHPKGPGAPPESGWHQDLPGVQGSPRTLTVWTPLIPGSLSPEVRPGSHRHGELPMRLSNDAIVGWETETAPGPVHHGSLRPGDILVLDAATVHRGMPNTGSGLRMSLDCRYQPLSDPVCEDCIELRGEPYTWDDVYRDWPGGRADPLAGYWLEQPLRRVPYDHGPDAQRDRTALTAARAGNPEARRALHVAARHSPDPAFAAAVGVLDRRLSAAAGSRPPAAEKRL
ncbi:phytanoyl-CoA dioxygenase family protein [Streptomyces sp. NPDC059788]|uniref:phytanoyl-CoA dioxygenase family protein n=1 Tax=Streptomyces sp. NPDC059788 TaxID=3346948 RepID=UPI00365A226E